MMVEEKPELIVIGGVNGAGKSNYIHEIEMQYHKYVVINPDEMFKAYRAANPGTHKIKAWKNVVKEINTNLNNKNNVILETTLSDWSIVKKIEAAKNAGYRVELHFIALDTVDRHIQRVANRVRKGGHDIPTADIKRRYERSFVNLDTLHNQVDYLKIFDNTKLTILLFEMENGIKKYHHSEINNEKINQVINGFENSRFDLVMQYRDKEQKGNILVGPGVKNRTEYLKKESKNFVVNFALENNISAKEMPDIKISIKPSKPEKDRTKTIISERQSQYGGKNQLAGKENNIAGKAQIDKQIMNSDDWLKAKSGDLDAAERVVDKLWPQKKTDQLKELIGDSDNKVLVTMPSTSRKNVIPIVLAQKLAKDLDVQVIQGDKYFDVLHRNEIKKISRFERIFYNREYKINKPFDENIQNKKAILIDDAFTTGGSVKVFSEVLAANGLKVSNVVGLMGDKRLRIDEKTEDKLKDALSGNNIDVDMNRLSNMLTRTEAGMLIQRINREGVKNEKLRELTGKIQGLVKGLSVEDITRDRNTGRDKSSGKGHFGNERNVKGIQSRGSRRGHGR